MSDEAGRRLNSRLPLPTSLIVAAAAFLSFAGTLGHGLVFDDDVLITGNPWVRQPGHLKEIFSNPLFGFTRDPSFSANYYRPLVHCWDFALLQLGGGRPWVLHLGLILLHVLAALGVAKLGVILAAQLEGADTRLTSIAALTAGILFAVHPVHVEAISWASGVMDAGASCAVVWALVLFVGPPGARRSAFSALLWLVALLFKESAIVAPVLALCWDLSRGPAGTREPPRVWVRRYAGFAGAFVAYLSLRLSAVGLAHAAHSGKSYGLAQVVTSAFALLWDHFALLVWPVQLNVLRLFALPTGIADLRVVMGALLMGSLIALGWVCWRRARPLFVPLCWMGLGLVPVLYVPSLGESLPADRYVYLSSVGFCLFIGLGAAELSRRPSRVWMGAAALLGVVALSFTFETVSYASAWKDDLTLWEDSVSKAPDQPFAHYKLGTAALRLNDLPRAVAELERAEAMGDHRPDLEINLAVAWAKSGRLVDARRVLTAAAEQTPGDARIRHNLGLVEKKLGQLEEADRSFALAAALNTDWGDPLVERGRVQEQLGQPEAALASFEEAARRAPSGLTLKLLADARARAAPH